MNPEDSHLLVYLLSLRDALDFTIEDLKDNNSIDHTSLQNHWEALDDHILTLQDRETI